MQTTLTTADAAKMLGCSERTIRNMIERGHINAIKIDPQAKSRYQIDRAEIQKILDLRHGKGQRRPR